MRMKNVLALVIAIVSLLSFSSCTDEDKALSVDQRLVGEWQLVDVSGDGSSVAIVPGFSFPSTFTISTRAAEGTLIFDDAEPKLQTDAKATLAIETMVGTDVVVVEEELDMDSKSDYTLADNELLLDKRITRLPVPTVIGTKEIDFQNSVIERVTADSLYLSFLYAENINEDEGFAVDVMVSLHTIWVR